MPIAHIAQPGAAHAVNLRIKPHDFLKQVLVMFCSACPPDFARKQTHLVRYLLNRTGTQFDTSLISVAMGLFDIARSTASRQSGISSVVNMRTHAVLRLSEISFPPFNFVMTLGAGAPQGLTDITGFRSYRIGETVDLCPSLQTLSVNTYLPGVYGQVPQGPDIR